MTAELPRARLHRAVFVAAGTYNLLWGLWAALDPGAFFRWAGMTAPTHPEVFACLGMVIGLYGLLYLEVARVPERGWPVAAIGLAGKLLGPLGALVLIARGDWPPRAFLLNVGNDLVWWLPFALYLRDSWPAWRASFGQR